jgi:nucleoside-diphosphate kinase
MCFHFFADYEDLKDRPFFPGLIKYMASGPVVGMVWQGLDAVKTGRAMLGATNPLSSQPGTSHFLSLLPLVCAKRYPIPRAKTKKGTIRGDFALATGRNICHGSDSVENAEKEIKLSVCISFWPCGVLLMFYYVQLVPRGHHSI